MLHHVTKEISISKYPCNLISECFGQIHILKDDAQRLQAAYPGENADQLAQLQGVVLEEWARLLEKSEARKTLLLDAADLHKFNADVN